MRHNLAGMPWQQESEREREEVYSSEKNVRKSEGENRREGKRNCRYKNELGLPIEIDD